MYEPITSTKAINLFILRAFHFTPAINALLWFVYMHGRFYIVFIYRV